MSGEIVNELYKEHCIWYEVGWCCYA